MEIDIPDGYNKRFFLNAAVKMAVAAVTEILQVESILSNGICHFCKGRIF